jgi:hypothetical protein
MIQRNPEALTGPASRSFGEAMRRLGETFAVRDVMVPLPELEWVHPGEEAAARSIVAEKRYSVIPISDDGVVFGSVFSTDHPASGERAVMPTRLTAISDYIPDSTPLAETFFLFADREWYLTLRMNRVSGLITYWDFNRREFRVQLYTGLSRIEELSRDALAKDGCGVLDETGLNLTPKAAKRIRKRFEKRRQKMGGNRFLDELEFSQVSAALTAHLPWREFLCQRLGKAASDRVEDNLHDLTGLRNAVMHGRVLFPTYSEFQEFNCSIASIGTFIDCLEAYTTQPQLASERHEVEA